MCNENHLGFLEYSRFMILAKNILWIEKHIKNIKNSSNLLCKIVNLLILIRTSINSVNWISGSKVTYFVCH